eukprot:gene19540-6739_t
MAVVSPLEMAVENRNLALIQILISHGASPFQKSEVPTLATCRELTSNLFRFTLSDPLVEKLKTMNAKDKILATCVMHNALYDIVVYLLAQGVPLVEG